MTVCAIAAMDEGRVIGREGTLPWNVPDDMRRFVSLTTGARVLLGRTTFESLRKKPLPGRINYVATHHPETLLARYPEVRITDDPLGLCNEYRGDDQPSLWVAGGAEIYRITYPTWDRLFLTIIRGRHEGDAFLLPFESDFVERAREEFSAGVFLEYRRATPKKLENVVAGL
jgi:dihydrofolate reductase